MYVCIYVFMYVRYCAQHVTDITLIITAALWGFTEEDTDDQRS